MSMRNAISIMYDILHLHRNSAAAKCAGLATMENEATTIRLGYGGTYQYKLDSDNGGWVEILFSFQNLYKQPKIEVI